MNYTNLKVYSTSLYGWQLSKRNWSTMQLVPYNYDNISTLTNYNEPVFLTPTVLCNHVFLFDIMGGYKEAFTGTVIPSISSINDDGIKSIDQVASTMPYFIKFNELHREIDTTNMIQYLKSRDSLINLKKIIKNQVAYYDKIMDYYQERQEYMSRCENQIAELAYSVKGKWK